MGIAKSFKRGISDLPEGPKASRLGCALGEISVNDDSNLMRGCVHTVMILLKWIEIVPFGAV